MIRNRWNRRLSGVGAVVLIGGLVLANYGGGVAPAEAHDNQKQLHNHPNPFRQILDKLTDILAKLDAGGGGGGAGNYTMRWDTNKLSERFTVLAEFGGAAVRDNNTGLVWEQSPSSMATWADARLQCLNKVVPAPPAVGGTRGWRLPSVAELTSLIDPSMPAPFVPGLFAGVQMAPYWSATTNVAQPSYSWSVDFGDRGLVGQTNKTAGGTLPYYWCVRGSMSESAY